MGRPKEHDEGVAAVLLDTAEALVETGGLPALSVRAVAAGASTTTRAVYSLFGSKSGLLAALGARTFDLLGAGVAAIPSTARPAGDLVEAGVTVFRQLATTRPALFQIGVQQTDLDEAVLRRIWASAESAFAVLTKRFDAMAAAGQLPGRDPARAAGQFHAMCEGLAAIELRGVFRGADAEEQWRDALSTLLAGMAIPTDRQLAPTGQ